MSDVTCDLQPLKVAIHNLRYAAKEVGEQGRYTQHQAGTFSRLADRVYDEIRRIRNACGL